MKKILLVLIVLLAKELPAQEFEGTVKWVMKMEFNDPKKQEQYESIKKREEENKKKKMMLDDQPENDSLQQSINQGGKGNMKGPKPEDAGSAFPSGLLVILKDGNMLTKIEGGRPGIEFLYLKEKDSVFQIDQKQKNYMGLPGGDKRAPNESKLKAEFQKTADTTSIAGYHCTKYIKTFVEREKTVIHEIWVTNELKDLDLKPLKKQRFGRHQFDFDSIEGVPLKMVAINYQGKFILEAVSVNRTTINPKVVKIPAEFKRRKM